jgi:COP9 signalosome complex subunit 3
LYGLQCVTSPTQQVSAIQLDAYKKLILLQLLKDGKMTSLPRYTSQAVTKAVRSRIANVEMYQNIAKAYEAEPPIQLYSTDKEQMRRQCFAVQDKLEKEVQKAMEVLKKDLNVGLAKQLVALFTRRRIQRLSRLFSRLKLSNLVDLLGGTVEGLSGDEACNAVMNSLRRMDADRWIRLTVEDHDTTLVIGDTIVQFSDFEVDHASLEAAQRLTRVMQEAKFWNQCVEVKQKSVRNSEGFLTKVR